MGGGVRRLGVGAVEASHDARNIDRQAFTSDAIELREAIVEIRFGHAPALEDDEARGARTEDATALSLAQELEL